MWFTPETADALRYWEPIEIDPRRGLDPETAAAELRALFVEVVTDQLPDRPVAIALSSGPGSNTVLAALVEVGSDVKAVSWMPTDIPRPETTLWAVRVAKQLGVEFIELPMDPVALLPESENHHKEVHSLLRRVRSHLASNSQHRGGAGLRGPLHRLRWRSLWRVSPGGRRSADEPPPP